MLILSHEDDEHATAVVDALKARHGVAPTLLDTARIPTALRLEVALDGRPGAPLGARVVEEDGGEVDLAAVHVAWWRRPRPFTIDPAVSDPVARRFAYGETMHAVGGLWSALDATWVNPPARDEEAGRKPYQLRVATRLGFEVPRTLITNDPDRARDLARELGPDRTIYKAFSGTEDAWRETRVLREDELEQLDDVRFAPLIFQQFVPAVRDLRVTVMGDRVFSSAVETEHAPYRADYRADLGAVEVRPHRLPAQVEARCLAVVRALGLVYGAIDLRETPDGRFVFLEVNPSGQWLFMAERTGQAMTEAFADLLVELAAANADAVARAA